MIATGGTVVTLTQQRHRKDLLVRPLTGIAILITPIQGLTLQVEVPAILLRILPLVQVVLMEVVPVVPAAVLEAVLPVDLAPVVVPEAGVDNHSCTYNS